MTRPQTDIEAAIDWLVRLQSDAATERDWRDFDAWLTASPDHAQAYDAALAFDERLDLDARLAERAASAAPAAKVVSRRTRRAWFWPATLAIGAIAATFVVVAVLPPSGRLVDGRETTYATGVGERRTIALEDGTRIELNAASRLSVRFERHARRVRLDDAQAFFDVVEDPSRPFLVEAGDVRVRVVGTQFDVRRRDGRVAVNVGRGLVEVRAERSGEAAPYRLRPGQGLSHQEGRGEHPRVSTIAVEEIASWRQGRLIYRDQPLSQVADDMNRLFPRPVKLGDAQAAHMRLSGVLIVDSQDAMVDRLSRLLPVRAETTDDAVLIRAR